MCSLPVSGHGAEVTRVLLAEADARHGVQVRAHDAERPDDGPGGADGVEQKPRARVQAPQTHRTCDVQTPTTLRDAVTSGTCMSSFNFKRK